MIFPIDWICRSLPFRSESMAVSEDVLLMDADPGDDDTYHSLDPGDDNDTYRSLVLDWAKGTDRPPASAANASFTACQSDLQSLGRVAEQQHAHSHRKDIELVAELVRTQETIPREEGSQFTRMLAWHKETPTSAEEESKKRQKVEDRVQQLQAELNMMKKEKEDFERKKAEVQDECEKAKRNVLVVAEKDKILLIEKSEHLHRINESLQLLLSQKEDTIQQLRKELRWVRGLHDAANDVSVVKQGSTGNEDINSSSSVNVGEAKAKVDSPNSSSCTSKEKHSDELKAMQEALEKSRELERKARQELTESAQQFQKEREEMVRRLEQQHHDEVAELKAKVKDAERHTRSNSQAVLLQKEEGLKQVNEKLRDATQEIGNLQVSVHVHD